MSEDENEIKYLGQDDIRDYIMKKDYEIYKLRQIINKAIDYIENNDLYTQDFDYDYDDNMVLLPPTDELERKILLEILRGKEQ